MTATAAVLAVLVVVLLAGAGVLTFTVLRQQAVRKQRNLFGEWPLARVSPERNYAGPRHAAGVYRALNELATRMPLMRIEATTLVAYRRPMES